MDTLEILIGVDPGLDGAMAIRWPCGSIEAFRVDKELDKIKSALITAKVYKTKITAIIEDVHAIYRARASTTFSFGRSVGFWMGVFYILGVNEIHSVKPMIWQKVAHGGVPRKKGKLSSKEKLDHKVMLKKASIEAAKKYCPHLKVCHDGVADAINILAYYVKL